VKILYLHQYFNTPEMNGSIRSYEMARHLVARGHEVHILTSERDSCSSGSTWRNETIGGIQVHWLAVPYSNKMSDWGRIRAFIRFAWRCARKALKVGGDLVFATSTPLTIALPAIYASKKLNVPMVFEVRDLWPEIPIAVGALKNPILIALARLLERSAYRNSARIVALSPGMATGVEKGGYDPARIEVVPNIADIQRFVTERAPPASLFARHPQLNDGPLVVYAGTLGMANGIGYLVDIAHAMLEIAPHIRFLIVGDGGEKTMIERQADELGVLNKTLLLLPPVSKKELPHILSAATIVTSFFINIGELWHNSANKFFDGLAAGKPILLNHQGWQAELIIKHEMGVVVPPENPTKSAAILSAYLADEEQCRNAGKRARRLAEEHFSLEVLADAFTRTLEAAAEERQKATL
jgi:glycosyltransferase involved in cell wall biosynthesis